MPTGVSDQHVQRYTQYCMRILSSRIQPLSSAVGASGAQQDLNNPADADHIKTQIMRKCKSIPPYFANSLSFSLSIYLQWLNQNLKLQTLPPHQETRSKKQRLPQQIRRINLNLKSAMRGLFGPNLSVSTILCYIY